MIQTAYSHHEKFEAVMSRIQELCPGKRLSPLRAEIVTIALESSTLNGRATSPIEVAGNILRLIEKGSDLDELVGHLRELGRRW